MKNLTNEELQKLSAAWLNWVKSAPSSTQQRSRERLRLIFLLIRYGGLRLSEAQGLNDLKALDYSTCTIKVTGSKAREVQIPEKAMKAIRSIVESPHMLRLRGIITHLDQGYIRRKFYAFAAPCGLDCSLVGPQVLRNSRCAELLHDNIPLSIVQKFLGQSSPLHAASLITFTDEDAKRIVHYHLRQETLRRTSARNVFTGTVSHLEQDTVSVLVELTTLKGLRVHAIITIESVQRLGILEGQILNATIKAPNVMLARKQQDSEYVEDGTNRFVGSVTGINRSNVETSVIVSINDGTMICSLLDSDELDELKLREGDKASVFFSPYSAVLTLPEG